MQCSDVQATLEISPSPSPARASSVRRQTSFLKLGTVERARRNSLRRSQEMQPSRLTDASRDVDEKDWSSSAPLSRGECQGSESRMSSQSRSYSQIHSFSESRRASFTQTCRSQECCENDELCSDTLTQWDLRRAASCPLRHEAWTDGAGIIRGRSGGSTRVTCTGRHHLSKDISEMTAAPVWTAKSSDRNSRLVVNEGIAQEHPRLVSETRESSGSEDEAGRREAAHPLIFSQPFTPERPRI